jgi:hypothetical protein
VRWIAPVALIGVSLLVSGCLSDQRRAAAKCELMTKGYKVDPADWRQPFVQKDNYMLLCMTSEGYEHFASLDECQATNLYESALLSGVMRTNCSESQDFCGPSSENGWRRFQLDDAPGPDFSAENRSATLPRWPGHRPPFTHFWKPFRVWYWGILCHTLRV